MGHSQTFTATDNNSNTLEYNITSSSTVEVKDYISGGTDIDIPSTVSNSGTTYNVTGIGIVAFLNNGLTSVVIPNSVISIGIGAFQSNVLVDITIPSSITSIANNAFFDNQLTSVIIPNSVTSIGDNAFNGNALSSLTIGNNVSSIGDFAFRNNPLSCIISEATTPPVINASNNGFDTFSIAQRNNINLSIPSGSSTINAYIAAQWTGFKSVAAGLTGTFVVDYITYQINPTPNNEVTVIGYNTGGGTVVNIPATVSSACTDFSVTSIGNNAFNSKNLTSVTIPDSVLNIGEGAFNNNSINNLDLGNGVESIGSFSFRINNLTSVTIPDSTISIASYAFLQNSINNLDLGNSVESIGNTAFASNSIVTLTIPDSVLTIGDDAFSNSNALTNLILGNSVVSIGSSAFRTIFNTITDITIPSSVTSIGDNAFSIPSLTDVTNFATTPPVITTTGAITSDTFGTYRSNINLYVPVGTTATYTTDSGALWTGFLSVTEGVLSTSNFELENDIKIISTTDKIEIKHSNSIQLQHYNIYSMSGAKIKEGKESNINTNTLSNGIYILELYFNEGRVAKKFIK